MVVNVSGGDYFFDYFLPGGDDFLTIFLNFRNFFTKISVLFLPKKKKGKKGIYSRAYLVTGDVNL